MLNIKKTKLHVASALLLGSLMGTSSMSFAETPVSLNHLILLMALSISLISLEIANISIAH